MADVREERAQIEPIVQALRALGIDCWFDARLEPGASFSEEIQRELHACRAQLVCWTPASAASHWVMGEADIGRQRGVLVPVSLAPTALPPPFNMLHAEDLTAFAGQVDHAGWTKTLASLGAKLGRPGLTALWPLLEEGDAAAWKSWAETNSGDPFVESAWANYERLHLDAEKSRMATERAAARKAAEEAEARRAGETLRAQEEAARLQRIRDDAAGEDEAARRAAMWTSAPPPREKLAARTTLFVSAVAGVAMLAALSVALMTQLPPRPAPPPLADAPPVQSITPASFAAMRLQGRWRTDEDAGCDAPLEIEVDGEWLVLRQTVRANTAGADLQARAETRERILRLSSDTIVTSQRSYEHSGDQLFVQTSGARYPLAACVTTD